MLVGHQDVDCQGEDGANDRIVWMGKHGLGDCSFAFLVALRSGVCDHHVVAIPVEVGQHEAGHRVRTRQLIPLLDQHRPAKESCMERRRDTVVRPATEKMRKQSRLPEGGVVEGLKLKK